VEVSTKRDVLRPPSFYVSGDEMGMIYRSPKFKVRQRAIAARLRAERAVSRKAREALIPQSADRAQPRHPGEQPRPVELVKNIRVEGVQGFAGVRDIAEVQLAVRDAILDTMAKLMAEYPALAWKPRTAPPEIRD
jgi:hypothetical protein